ncbi:MAG: hypothetical protein JZD41_07870 [Thermoproteus sp.]|nr:hypothetical protein [Thermoproteus sp.]
MASEYPTLACERSAANFPIGSTTMEGWVYICMFNCPQEVIVKSAHAESVYCSSIEKFYRTLSVVLQYGDPVSFGPDYFAVRLRVGYKDHVLECITKRSNCKADYWFLVVRITSQAVLLFTTDAGQLEELFNATTTKPFISVSGAEAMAHAITEAVKDAETVAATTMSVLDLGKYKGAMPGRAMGNYAALTEALAQIISSCFAFGSDFMRRNLRYMACGNFVPIPPLLNIVKNLKQCESAHDWDCTLRWHIELEDLIEAYRRPGPPYMVIPERKNIFGAGETGS